MLSEVKAVEVNLAQITLENGTALEAVEFAPENEVFIVNEEDRIPLPVGEYTLEDKRILVVAEEGVIAEVKDAPAEEEAEAPAAEVEVEVEAETAETREPKRVIKSEVVEQHFAEEEVSEEVEVTAEYVTKEEFTSAVEEIKTMIAELMPKVEEETKVEMSAEPATKRIKHSPDATSQKQGEVKLSARRNRNTLDSVLSKLSK